MPDLLRPAVAPAPPLITPLKLDGLALTRRVRLNPAASIGPVKRVPPPELDVIIESAASVTTPAKVFVPVLVQSAPMPSTPVPLMVIGSAARYDVVQLRVAPDATTVPAAVAPSALSAPSTRRPAVTVVTPP